MKQRGLERAWAWALNVVFRQTLPGLCFADHSVCWKHAKKGKKYQISWSVLNSSHISSPPQRGFKPVCAEWLRRFHSGAYRIPHEAKRECVGEDKASGAHTHLSARQPERTPLLPYTERRQALRRANNQLTFITSVSGPFGTAERRRCLWTGRLAPSRYRAEKRGDGMKRRLGGGGL